MEETRGDHPIDIAINSGDESSKPCIFKVPDILCRHSPKSFSPNSFSIGPLHYKKKYLKAQKKAEKIKQHYLNNLLTRKPTPQTTREDFKRSILEVEEKARQCYDVPFDHLSKDTFVDMLVLDGCFIIELLRNNEIATKKIENNSSSNNNNNNSSSSNNEDDPVFSVSWVVQVLYHDLILLENQIPWFVLVRLFDMTTSPTISGSTKSLTGLALGFFGTLFTVEALPKIEGSLKINHILDLLRNALVSSSGTRQESMKKGSHESNHIPDFLTKALVSLFGTRPESTRDWQQIPTATSLKESGITFKKRNSSNLLAIKFAKHGVLEIPTLLIQETTCEMFRNLISYEQCYTNCDAKITSYAILLNNLINTTEDIKVLHEADIVDNWLNPNDTLEFFNNIYTDTYVREFCYVEIYQQVKKYRNRWWPRTRAAVVHNLFFNPLIIASEIVAVIALILTILQTWYSVLEYKRESSRSPLHPS